MPDEEFQRLVLLKLQSIEEGLWGKKDTDDKGLLGDFRDHKVKMYGRFDVLEETADNHNVRISKNELRIYIIGGIIGASGITGGIIKLIGA